MKFLVNNKEYSEFLAHSHSLERIKNQISVTDPSWKKSQKLEKALKEMLSPSLIPDLKLTPLTLKDQHRIKQFIEYTVEEDLVKWESQQMQAIQGLGKQQNKNFFKYINKNFDRFTGEERQYIFKKYAQSNYKTITKVVGNAWPNIEYIPRDLVDIWTSEKIFIRNTVNNEDLLKTRMEHNLPFMFMDSGYTNFLESGKVWHRLCKNHIHNNQFSGKFNSKRMDMFKCLPRAWRDGGHDIIIVEPSTIQCKLFDIDIEHWRNWVQSSIEQYLEHPKRIVFREKVDKKIRQSFYQYLLDEDVYCVINYNSNAAVEAIWAGVPVITLGKHITNMVTVDSIDKINHLERPDLEVWLKRLSYSQYTLEEIEKGVAKEILERHFNV